MGRAVWLVSSLLLILAGARWGAHVGFQRQLKELEAKLRHLEAQQDVAHCVSLQPEADYNDDASTDDSVQPVAAPPQTVLESQRALHSASGRSQKKSKSNKAEQFTVRKSSQSHHDCKRSNLTTDNTIIGAMEFERHVSIKKIETQREEQHIRPRGFKFELLRFNSNIDSCSVVEGIGMLSEFSRIGHQMPALEPNSGFEAIRAASWRAVPASCDVPLQRSCTFSDRLVAWPNMASAWFPTSFFSQMTAAGSMLRKSGSGCIVHEAFSIWSLDGSNITIASKPLCDSRDVAAHSSDAQELLWGAIDSSDSRSGSVVWRLSWSQDFRASDTAMPVWRFMVAELSVRWPSSTLMYTTSQSVSIHGLLSARSQTEPTSTFSAAYQFKNVDLDFQQSLHGVLRAGGIEAEGALTARPPRNVASASYQEVNWQVPWSRSPMSGVSGVGVVGQVGPSVVTATAAAAAAVGLRYWRLLWAVERPTASPRHLERRWRLRWGDSPKVGGISAGRWQPQAREARPTTTAHCPRDCWRLVW